jgi:heme/copper-type cytochrome/quinol oxidase subunit 3
MTSTSYPCYNPLEIPLFNTLLLLLSGFSLTWVHKALVNGLVKDVIDGWIITLTLGTLFLILQIMEYYESTYSFNDSVYGCTFYMLTGLHGMHVFVGVTFLFICFKRYLYKHFTTNHHLGFLFAA